MHEYIRDLAYIIKNGEMENTYKMAWVRSIVEHCVINPDKPQIHFDELSKRVFGNYWDQLIFFKLEQSPNPYKKPEICQIVLDQIRKYQSHFGFKPEWFSKIEHKVLVPQSKISTVLSKDVCWRFLRVSGNTFDIYHLDKARKIIEVRRPDLINQYSDVLFELINYRWSQKLEEFNHSPRITKKVRGTDREQIRRSNLSKFKRYIDLENPKHLCFYSGEPLAAKDVSIDHVLPWSFLYSDDLWNLVYVSKSYNSIKSNRVPDESVIKRLQSRNVRLQKILHAGGIEDKHTQELELSIDNDLVKKFWMACKG